MVRLLAQAVPPALPVSYEQLPFAAQLAAASPASAAPRASQPDSSSDASPQEAPPHGHEEAVHALTRVMTLRRQRWRTALADALTLAAAAPHHKSLYFCVHWSLRKGGDPKNIRIAKPISSKVSFLISNPHHGGVGIE